MTTSEDPAPLEDAPTPIAVDMTGVSRDRVQALLAEHVDETTLKRLVEALGTSAGTYEQNQRRIAAWLELASGVLGNVVRIALV